MKCVQLNSKKLIIQGDSLAKFIFFLNITLTGMIFYVELLLIHQLCINTAHMSSSAKPIQVNQDPTAAGKHCLHRIHDSTLVYPRSSLFFHLLGFGSSLFSSPKKFKNQL